jgi:TolB-like protein/DNA-binding winged helix-turn-helix (wHTH) protein/Flp pilus assembly protein TadD
VPLTPKVFDLLEVLVRHSGHLVEKDELLREVWPDSFVEEGNLNRNVSILRKVLGEDVSGQPYIETVPKRGYRFVAKVKILTGEDLEKANSERARLDAQVRVPEIIKANPESGFQPKGTSWSHRWLVFSGLAALMIGTVIYAWMHWKVQTALKPEIKSLAVIPLQNLSGDRSQEYFADGMTEALISNLAQIRALRVISRTSVMQFKGSQKPLPALPEIARDLGVDGVIEGAVQRENGQVKVSIQLIHAPTDTHLWARAYERAATDVLKLQGEMARAIADEIRIQVTSEERARMASATIVNPAAHEAYLLGRYHLWKYIIDHHPRAIAHFERAVQLDPTYAPAYAGLSMALQLRGVQAGLMKEVAAPAREAVHRALELNHRLPEAYVAQGHLHFFYDWDWRSAENSIRRALELDPNNLDGHFNYAILLMALGRFPEAVAEIQNAQRVDPLSHQVQVGFGRILFYNGKSEEAIQHLKQAIEREPRSAMAHKFLGEVYEQVGRYSEALAIHDKARVLRGNPPDNPPFLEILARVYARMGRRSEAKRILKDLGDDVSPEVYAALGDNDEAFRSLLKLIEARNHWLPIFIKTHPQFACLHSDPRWQDLLRRMNLL